MRKQVGQLDIDLKLYRGQLIKGTQRFPKKITNEMIQEFDNDVASGELSRKLLAAGRAEKWLENLYD